MNTLSEAAQALAADAIVELYELDTSPLGGAEIFYFTSSVDNGDAIRFEGKTYVPAPFEAEGFVWSGRGAPARPRIRIGNVTRLVSAAVIEFNDLLGARFTRIRTLKSFLDGHENESASPRAFQRDIYVIERKSAQNKVFVEFELASALDQTGLRLPGRRATRRYCPLVYRRWDAGAGAFDYANVTCPWIGRGGSDGPFFTLDDRTTGDPARDRCSKFLSGCAARFNKDPLPFGGFPGVGRAG